MIEDDSLQDDLPLVNTQKLKYFLILYKLPLIFSLAGIFLFAAAIVLILKDRTDVSSVIFTTESSPSAAVKIRVDVEGAVMTPGVYNLLEGSRILDALISAGGLSQKADRDYITKNLNKAAKLVDGSKIYIPSANETISSLSLPAQAGISGHLSNIAGITSGTVNINSASQSQLEDLPGVGPVTAGKIIAGRPYQTIEELKSKKIVGNALFEKIKDLITLY